MTVKFEWDQEDVMDDVNESLDGGLYEVAQKIYQSAKNSSAFKDKTGKLRASIALHKSKFENGGYIILADAQHAHLIEFGHGGKHPAPAHPFLRPAKDKHINDAKRVLGAKD